MVYYNSLFLNSIQGSQAHIRNYFTANVKGEKYTTSIPHYLVDDLDAIPWQSDFP